MEWAIEVTGEFERCWDSLSEAEQEDVRGCVVLLREYGPTLRFPFKHRYPDSEALSHERIAHPAGRRTLSCSVHDQRWYETFVPIADRLYDDYIADLKREGLLDG